MTAGPTNGYYRYRYHTVAVQLFYNLVLLEKLDRKHFLSWEKQYVKKHKDKQPDVKIPLRNLQESLKHNFFFTAVLLRPGSSLFSSTYTYETQ